MGSRKNNFPFCTADPSRPATLLLLELALPVLRCRALPDRRPANKSPGQQEWPTRVWPTRVPVFKSPARPTRVPVFKSPARPTRVPVFKSLCLQTDADGPWLEKINFSWTRISGFSKRGCRKRCVYSSWLEKRGFQTQRSISRNVLAERNGSQASRQACEVSTVAPAAV